MRKETVDVENVEVQNAMAWATGKAVMSWFRPDEDGAIRPLAIQCAPPAQRGGALWETDFSEQSWQQHP